MPWRLVLRRSATKVSGAASCSAWSRLPVRPCNRCYNCCSTKLPTSVAAIQTVQRVAAAIEEVPDRVREVARRVVHHYLTRPGSLECVAVLFDPVATLAPPTECAGTPSTHRASAHSGLNSPIRSTSVIRSQNSSGLNASATGR